MNKLISIENEITRIKSHSQQIGDEIASLKEQDISANFYLGNLRRLSLQALDLFTAMQKQINSLNNQKKYLESKYQTIPSKRRVVHGLSME